DIEAALNEEVAQYAEKINFGYLGFMTNMQIQFDSSPRKLKLGELPLSAQLNIGKVLQSEENLEDITQKMQAQIGKLRSFARSDTFIQLYSKMETALLRSEKVTYRLKDIQVLRNFLLTGNIESNPFPVLLAYAESPDGKQYLSLLDQTILLALRINYFEPIRALSGRRDHLLDQIAQLNQEIDGEGGLDHLIAEGILRANAAEWIGTQRIQIKTER
ncbi:MAG: hypothetical protein AAF804_22490, partial [Bacteroidota bacterium]